MKIKLNGNELELTDEQAKEIAEKYGSKKETKVVGVAIKSRFIEGTIIFQSTKTTLKEAVLEAVDSCANLSGANLNGADLSYANLSGANLNGADLSYANLRDANLRAANLSDANLSGANLRAANLSDANLSGANLRAANLRGAELDSAKFYGRGGTKTLKQSQLPDFLAALGFVIED